MVKPVYIILMIVSFILLILWSYSTAQTETFVDTSGTNTKYIPGMYALPYTRTPYNANTDSTCTIFDVYDKNSIELCTSSPSLYDYAPSVLQARRQYITTQLSNVTTSNDVAKSLSIELADINTVLQNVKDGKMPPCRRVYPQWLQNPLNFPEGPTHPLLSNSPSAAHTAWNCYTKDGEGEHPELQKSLTALDSGAEWAMRYNFNTLDPVMSCSDSSMHSALVKELESGPDALKPGTYYLKCAVDTTNNRLQTNTLVQYYNGKLKDANANANIFTDLDIMHSDASGGKFSPVTTLNIVPSVIPLRFVKFRFDMCGQIANMFVLPNPLSIEKTTTLGSHNKPLYTQTIGSNLKGSELDALKNNFIKDTNGITMDTFNKNPTVHTRLSHQDLSAYISPDEYLYFELQTPTQSITENVTEFVENLKLNILKEIPRTFPTTLNKKGKSLGKKGIVKAVRNQTNTFNVICPDDTTVTIMNPVFNTTSMKSTWNIQETSTAIPAAIPAATSTSSPQHVIWDGESTLTWVGGSRDGQVWTIEYRPDAGTTVKCSDDKKVYVEHSKGLYRIPDDVIGKTWNRDWANSPAVDCSNVKKTGKDTWSQWPVHNDGAIKCITNDSLHKTHHESTYSAALLSCQNNGYLSATKTGTCPPPRAGSDIPIRIGDAFLCSGFNLAKGGHRMTETNGKNETVSLHLDNAKHYPPPSPPSPLNDARVSKYKPVNYLTTQWNLIGPNNTPTPTLMSCWVNIEKLPNRGQYATIWEFGFGEMELFQLLISNTSNVALFALTTTTKDNGAYVRQQTTVSTDIWYNYTAIYVPNHKIHLYLNGKKIGETKIAWAISESATVTLAIANNATTSYVGNGWRPFSGYFQNIVVKYLDKPNPSENHMQSEVNALYNTNVFTLPKV